MLHCCSRMEPRLTMNVLSLVARVAELCFYYSCYCCCGGGGNSSTRQASFGCCSCCDRFWSRVASSTIDYDEDLSIPLRERITASLNYGSIISSSDNGNDSAFIDNSAFVDTNASFIDNDAFIGTMPLRDSSTTECTASQSSTPPLIPEFPVSASPLTLLHCYAQFTRKLLVREEGPRILSLQESQERLSLSASAASSRNNSLRRDAPFCACTETTAEQSSEHSTAQEDGKHAALAVEEKTSDKTVAFNPSVEVAYLS